jgi:hypothetical protein
MTEEPRKIIAYDGLIAIEASVSRPGERYYFRCTHPHFTKKEVGVFWAEKKDDHWVFYRFPYGGRLIPQKMDSLEEIVQWVDEWHVEDYSYWFHETYTMKTTAQHRDTLTSAFYTVDFTFDRIDQWEYAVLEKETGKFLFRRKDFKSRLAAKDNFVAWEYRKLGKRVTAEQMQEQKERIAHQIEQRFTGSDDEYYLMDAVGKIRYTIYFTFPTSKLEGSGWRYTKSAHDRQGLHYCTPILYQTKEKAIYRMAADIVNNGYESDFDF